MRDESPMGDDPMLDAELAATLSHELRTPLAAIVTMAELLLESTLDAEQRRLALCLHTSGRSLLHIFDDLLDLARREVGQRNESATREFDSRKCVSSIVALFAPQARRKEIRITSTVAPDIPLVLGEESRVRQILINLVGNAVKFTSAGSVSIAACVAERSSRTVVVRFEIEDSGIGIEAATAAKLFQPYVQASPEIAPRFGGTGLGLSVSKRLVDVMGGRIGFTSESQAGSTFWFELPFQVSEGRATQAPRAVPTDALGHVLLVEDNPVNEVVVRKQLEKLGYTVTYAGDGRVALELLERRCFDIIFMDVEMAGMNGRRATTEIRRKERLSGKHVPIVGLSAHSRASDRTACLRDGMDDFLTKPASLTDLSTVLARWAETKPR